MRRNAATIIKYLLVASVLFGMMLIVLYVNHTPDATGSQDAGESDKIVNQPVVQHLDPLEKIDWHDYKQIEKEKARVGPGEQGTGVHIDASENQLKDKLFRENGFSGLASDKMSLERAVRDIRHQECRTQKYQRDLPTASIIIPFFEEHWSTLLRTFISSLNRAPPNLIKEVILVDDSSTKPFLKAQLDEYVAKNYRDKVRILREGKREGLIRTRLTGARNATGDVLIFLDSHCEANVNWLPPLLDPIAEDYRTVVCPFIDVLDFDTFEYRAQDEGARGSFDWEFFYKRLPLLPDDLQHPARPFKSPVMAGGLFAISRKWFWELGGYDPGLDIWGGEQYELSFKIWQCGGRMVDSACSRIGHVYRKYAPFPNPGIGDFVGRNYKRVAEVWMDEYKEYLYMRRPHYRTIDPGNLSGQRQIRERLKCKPFKWFMTEIAFDQPQHYPMVEPNLGAEGEIRLSAQSSLCIDTKFQGEMKEFGLAPCLKDKPGASGEQAMEFGFRKDIRPKGRSVCFDVASSTEKAPVILYPCHGMKGNQHWKYNPWNHQLLHVLTNKCLDSDVEAKSVFMRTCDPGKLTQQWVWQKWDKEVIERDWK